MTTAVTISERAARRIGFGAPPRACLLCNHPAVDCMRLHRHSPDRVIDHARHLLRLIWNRKRQNLLLTVEILCSFLATGLMVGTAQVAEAARPKKQESEVQKSLKQAYPDAETQVTGTTDVNGVKVHDVAGGIRGIPVHQHLADPRGQGRVEPGRLPRALTCACKSGLWTLNTGCTPSRASIRPAKSRRH